MPEVIVRPSYCYCPRCHTDWGRLSKTPREDLCPRCDKEILSRIKGGKTTRRLVLNHNTKWMPLKARIEGSSTPDACIAAIQYVARGATAKDALKAVLVAWRQALESEDVRIRLGAAATLIQMAAIVELNRLDQRTPEEVIRDLDKAELVGILRSLYAEGAFTLDDIDPPPEST